MTKIEELAALAARAQCGDRIKMKPCEARVLLDEIAAIGAQRDHFAQLIENSAQHWLALQAEHPIAWEGAVDAAFKAACDEIRRLKQPAAELEPHVELMNIIGRLRAFFLKHKAEPPIALVLDDRNALSFLRSIAQRFTGWCDIRAVEGMAMHGIGFRFERGKE